MEEDVDKYALYGGEDFELLFTAGEEEVTKLAEHSKNFAVIGKITDDAGQVEMQTGEGDVISFEK